MIDFLIKKRSTTILFWKKHECWCTRFCPEMQIEWDQVY